MNPEKIAGARLSKESRPKGFAALAGIAAAALLAAAPPLCSAGREPFVTWFYPICWYALIVLLDALLVLAGSRSFILGGGAPAARDGGAGAAVVTGPGGGFLPSPEGGERRTAAFFFPVLLFWSAAVWFFFEALNFRLADWYYVYIPDSRWVRVVSSFLSFATVLPALFLVERALERAGLFRGLACRPLRLGPGGRRALVAAGLLCLALPMARPRLFFPLVWLALAFLCAPLNEKRLEDSLLAGLAAGRPGRLLRILAAGLVCGAIWEFLNSFARIRWIYTVPFMEDVKIFEMPPLGFLGFPPFAVECVAVYGLLAGFGLAPGTGRIRRRAGVRPLGPAAVVAVVVASVLLPAWKEVKILTFDREYGASLGLPMRRLDHILTALLVATIVLGLQTVGVVLMSAMIVAPGAAARQWTRSLGSMVTLAAGIGLASGVAGAVLSSVVPRLPTGPTIVLILSGVVAVSLLAAPERGLIHRRLRLGRLRRRPRQEPVLMHLFALSLQHPEDPDHGHEIAVIRTMSPPDVDVEAALEALESRGLAASDDRSRWAPTELGRREARRTLDREAER